jgi:microcystin-dependent protein
MSGKISTTSAHGSGTISGDLDAIGNFVGMIQSMAGDKDDTSGWLRCDGASMARADYPSLFAAIGTTWGTVDSNTFTLPNLNAAFLRGAGNHTSQMGTAAVYAGGSVGAYVNDTRQAVNLAAPTSLSKIGGPQYQGWFNGRTIGSHSMAFRTGVFYYDHNQGGTSQYVVNSFAPFNYSMASKGGTDATSGGTRRAGGETKPFSATVQYCVYAGAKGS